MDRLEQIVEGIRAEFEAKTAARDLALQRSRALIRDCAGAIRATHRGESREADAMLEAAGGEARRMAADLEPYPDLYYAGYTQDALKEYVEARAVFAFVHDRPLPAPEELGVEGAAYLKGVAEAASELRRHTLHLLRQPSGELSRAETMMSLMDDVYTQLITVDFADAITGGLRRTTDMLRGVVERTRGDLTTAMRQEMMRRALREFEERIGMESGAPPFSAPEETHPGSGVVPAEARG